MRRARPSNAERLLRLKQLEQHQALDKRRYTLYNRKYKKSMFFVSAWIVRLIYILLFVAVFLFNEEPGSIRPEVVSGREVERYIQTTKRGSYPVTILHIETNFNTYFSEFGALDPPDFSINDTLLIERNVFTKAIYFTKSDWDSKYKLHTRVVYYYMLLFLTFISLFFNDGLDRFTHKVLLAILVSNILAFMLYFLM